MLPGRQEKELLREAVEDVDQLGKTLGALGLSLLDPVGDAFFHVEFQHGQADAIEGRLGSGQLLEDLDAQPRLLDHASDAPDLPFDPVQPRDERLLLGGV
jgi:hypothetical protein